MKTGNPAFAMRLRFLTTRVLNQEVESPALSAEVRPYILSKLASLPHPNTQVSLLSGGA
jgi:hypothetical protein